MSGDEVHPSRQERPQDVRLRKRSSAWRLGTAVLLFGLVVTALLAWTAWTANARSESRLLGLQVKEAGSLLGAVAPVIQTPLTSAVELATATNGSASRFDQFMAPEVKKGSSFIGASLWRIQGRRVTEIASLGRAPLLSETSPTGHAFFLAADKSPLLHVTGLLSTGSRRLGYAVTAPARHGAYLVYSESAVGERHRGAVERGSAFADLNYALYLGRSPSAGGLLQTTADKLPLPDPTASAVVAFGNSYLTLVATPATPLVGWLPENLPWLIAALGAVLTLGAAAMVARIAQRRQFAEALAAQNERLFAEQQGVAATLQRALLPEELPESRDAEHAVRYLAASRGVAIGGDWYDIIEHDDDLLLVVGDVSGHGLRAATVMASLRFSIRAYCVLGDDPATLLSRLSGFVDTGRDAYFATVLCARINLASHELEVCNAGHPPLLLLDDSEARYIDAPIGPPVGVPRRAPYQSVTVTTPAKGTLVVYTDGLIERAGESLDVGSERLRRSAITNASLPLPELLDSVLEELLPEGPTDDVALMGLRWQD